jgi:transcriptional regulator
VGIELLVDRIDAKRKLSQNRSAEDVASVVAGLSGGSPAERAVADDMRAQAAKTP